MTLILLILIIINTYNCWDLSSLNISSEYYVNSVAVHRSRAFLALPRSVCPNNHSTPTLIEVHWNEHVNHDSNKRSKIIATQHWNKCETIQDAVSLEMESSKPKLWILDKGNEICSPKILSYNLLTNNIDESIELTNIDGTNLNTIVIDQIMKDELERRGYVGNSGENILLVFCLKKLTWWKLHLSHPNVFSIPINADFLTISKVKSELFLTGKRELDVFSINLEPIRHIEVPKQLEAEGVTMTYNITHRGKKLGTSTGIESDHDFGLIYFMTRDYAIVRWDTRFPLVAEHHTVFIQSYEIFPYVTRFFTDSEEAIWALVNPMSPDECIKRNVTNESIPFLNNRAVRLLKYVKVKNEGELKAGAVENKEKTEEKQQSDEEEEIDSEEVEEGSGRESNKQRNEVTISQENSGEDKEETDFEEEMGLSENTESGEYVNSELEVQSELNNFSETGTTATLDLNSENKSNK